MMSSLEIAYVYSRHSFSWLYTIDDLIMVIPYFWCYILCHNNDRIPDGFARKALVLAVISFFFFFSGVIQLRGVWGIVMLIVAIIYIIYRFIWLFYAFSIFKRME